MWPRNRRYCKIENSQSLTLLALVAKVHKEGQRYSSKGYEVILIGHEGHPEVEGTMGRISGDVYLVSNTEDVYKLKVKTLKNYLI